MRKQEYIWWGSLSINEQEEYRKAHPFFGNFSKEYFYLHKSSIEQVYKWVHEEQKV